MDAAQYVNERIEYSFSLLKKHQETCGELSLIGEGRDQYIECNNCHMKMVNGGGKAIFQLKGYDIELS